METMMMMMTVPACVLLLIQYWHNPFWCKWLVAYWPLKDARDGCGSDPLVMTAARACPRKRLPPCPGRFLPPCLGSRLPLTSSPRRCLTLTSCPKRFLELTLQIDWWHLSAQSRSLLSNQDCSKDQPIFVRSRGDSCFKSCSLTIDGARFQEPRFECSSNPHWGLLRSSTICFLTWRPIIAGCFQSCRSWWYKEVGVQSIHYISLCWCAPPCSLSGSKSNQRLETQCLWSSCWSAGLLTDQMQFHALLKVILVAGDKTELLYQECCYHQDLQSSRPSDRTHQEASHHLPPLCTGSQDYHLTQFM